MKHDKKRYGTFSSSSAWKLTKEGKGKDKYFGEKALTYIKQTKYEIKLGRPINKEAKAKPTTWGVFMEKRVDGLLQELYPFEYNLVSAKRLFHKDYEWWSGAPDFVKLTSVVDNKSPYSLEMFCKKVDALKDIEVYKNEFEEDYWQHISNAILLESNGIDLTHFEAIIYVPYQSELSDIRDSASNYDGNQNDIAFLNWTEDEELPYLIDGGEYKNLNIFSFEIPKSDKEYLTERFVEASKKLLSI